MFPSPSLIPGRIFRSFFSCPRSHEDLDVTEAFAHLHGTGAEKGLFEGLGPHAAAALRFVADVGFADLPMARQVAG